MAILVTAITARIGSSFSSRGRDKAPGSFYYRKTESYLSFIVFPFWPVQNESHWQYQNHGNMMEQ